jgi:DNA invertase Pin-like site-specific DNA recombinase
MEGNFVAYYRVSTDKQDTDCATQKADVLKWLNGGDHDLIAERTEVETGKRNDRPKLQEALALCRKHKATLVIAKLDRLGRNMAFISALMDSKVKFVAIDSPHASRLELHAKAMVAEEERRLIAQRTKDRLQYLKAQGTPWVSKKTGRLVERLGSPNPRKGSAAGCEAQRNKADEFAVRMLPIIDAIRSRGMTTLQAIADELTRQKWPTARGADAWSMVAVSGILKRIPA